MVGTWWYVKKRCFGAKNTFWASKCANYVVFLRIFCFFDFFYVFGDIVYFVKIKHIIHGNGLNRPEIWNLREILDKTGIPTRLRGLLVPKNELSKKYFWEKYFDFFTKTIIFCADFVFFSFRFFVHVVAKTEYNSEWLYVSVTGDRREPGWCFGALFRIFSRFFAFSRCFCGKKLCILRGATGGSREKSTIVCIFGGFWHLFGFTFLGTLFISWKLNILYTEMG